MHTCDFACCTWRVWCLFLTGIDMQQSSTTAVFENWIFHLDPRCSPMKGMTDTFLVFTNIVITIPLTAFDTEREH